MTLIEIMVSSGLVGIVFMAMMFLLYQSGRLGRTMNGNFQTIEGVSDAVGQFTGVLNQVTKIKSCHCRGSVGTKANCIWDSSSPLYDPVRLGGLSPNGSSILSGEFEAFDGAQGYNSMAALTTSAINLGGQTCQATTGVSASYTRGCKLPFDLQYTAPENTTPSTAGMLVLKTGDNRSVQVGAKSVRGADGLGITELGCGFESSTGGVGGSDFVLNIRVKARTNIVNDATNPNYESWYPTGASYSTGMFREIQLKFAMRNIINRGVYFWRPESYIGCIQSGAATSVDQCCSQAWDGSSCLATCVAAGGASGSRQGCCSGRLSGGACL